MSLIRCETHQVTYDTDRADLCPICECASDVERYGIKSPADRALPGSSETRPSGCEPWSRLGRSDGGAPHRR